MELLNNLPSEYLMFIFITASALLTLLIVLVFWIVKNRDVKLKDIEIVSKSQKELYQTEGKNMLDNQTSNAHNLLKKIWIDIFEAGRSKFNITDQTELFLLEDIAHLIEGKLNYEVKNDLTRNHITEKGDLELQRYSDAKAAGYYHSVKASLYQFNVQLPQYDLPDIMTGITMESFKTLFNDLYFNARKIAGGEQCD